MAMRYSVLPSTLLNLDIDELNWNYLIFQKGVELEYKQQKQQQLELKQKNWK